MVLGRLRHTERKLAKYPLLLVAYRAKFDEYLEKRKCAVWYIPHFGVTTPIKPGKLRLVFDASARSNGVSLNEALSKEPDLIRPLTSILWIFRVHNIALTGDITDIFHRVRVIEEVQCSQRFLWRNMNTSIEPNHYEMQVLIFGATSSPCSAIHAKNENAMQHELVNHELAHTIVNDFYVDDCLTGADSEEICMDLRRELSEVNEVGGFHLCKFTSNSRAVVESILEELSAKGVESLNEKSLISAGIVLGMWWDLTKDVFGFKFGLNKVPPEILEGAVPTRRQASSLWIAGIGWDEELTPDIYAAWKLWLSKLKEIISFKCHSATFQTCLAEVSFDKWRSTHLLMPAKKLSPLEKWKYYYNSLWLQSKSSLNEEAYHTKIGAARPTCRERDSLSFFASNCDFQKWTGSDSKTILAWIRSEAGRYKEFEAIKGTDWRWVPTSENPVDIATRFETEILFKPTDMWYTRPEFLKRPEEEWPNYLNYLFCRAAAVHKAAQFWYKKTFHKSAKIARLSPCLINGPICLKSRILQANNVPAEQKTSPILPSNHHVTELLIKAEHERCAHQGSETLLNNLHGRFWIIDGRQTVLRTIPMCPRCRLSRASPVILEMGQLPHYRLAAYQCPFTFTGLYAFVPFT
ncbi:hypothetical protein LAZ67_20000648 [Cordylochernes scorpioides]|uniref:Integrase zinc-binding domain-containing protein n=1 Tax=Cordylochernes scorpioides TaxID=51811 RepID=A0ABY6LJB0_9ARAC|nr:hypothetical protein LAZ67_20000648 [Cordylochernes scorpioides]